MPDAVRVLVAVAAALVIYLIGVRIVRVMMAPAPPDEPDLSKLKPVDYRYRCMVCGTEVTMTATPDPDLDGDDAAGDGAGGDGAGAQAAAAVPDAPRHCREDMALLGAHARS